MTSRQKSSLTSHDQEGRDPKADERGNIESVNYQTFNPIEQEIKFLKIKLAELEEDKAAKMKTFNEETNNLEGQVARLRAQVERGEATRQNLEYELTLAKKATNQVKRIAVEKEVENNNNLTAMKNQLSELTKKLSEAGQDLTSTKNQLKNDKENFHKEIQQKEAEIQNLMAQLESSQNECTRLHKIVQEQQNSMVELQEKCSSLEAQRQSQNNTLRHQAKDLEFTVEREERLKKEVEQTREKLKTVEEHVEAERASHLETKFNSEIVQLRVRDLEGELEVKSTALKEAEAQLDTWMIQCRELEESFRKEQVKCDELSTKMKQLQEKYSNEKKRTKQDQEEKQQIIKGLSDKLEAHQVNFDALKKELSQAKKHQSEFDQNYNTCLKDLQKLVMTFGKAKSPKSKTGRNKKHVISSQSSVLIDDLRQILLELQMAKSNLSNEVKQLKIMLENLTRENTGYQELMWSRDQAVEDVKKAAKSVKQELSAAQLQLANKETVYGELEVEIQELKKNLEEERRNFEKCSYELAQIKSRKVNDDQTRLSFLHTIYQCLVAGQFHKTPSNDSYENFSWDDMMRLLSDQIENHVSELNRAKDKVVHLEDILNDKEHHIKQTQESHEATIRKLSTTVKERENSWKLQNKEMEEHYGKLVTDLHLRAQKTQEMGDECWEKLQQTTKINEELAVQNKTLKNSRKKYIKEKSALLASCALLAGTLWPACAQIEVLKSQKRTLILMNSSLNILLNHTRFLCEAINSELSNEDNVPSSSAHGSRHGGTLLLKFRIGVVAILALNRLINFAVRQKTCIIMPGGVLGGLDSTLVVRCGISRDESVEFQGIGQGERHSEQAIISPSWLYNEQLMAHTISSMNDLCEKISRRDEKEPTRSWSPDSCVSITRTAKHCYQKLLDKLQQEFENELDVIVGGSRLQSRSRGNLILVLGNGLRRCLKKLADSERHRYASIQDLASSLQNFVLGLTQRLHRVEVERRDLKMDMNAMQKENEELKRMVEKRQVESQQVYKDMEGMREKFENLNSQLTKALEREKQAQNILSQQAAQLKDLERRLHAVNQDSEQSETTLAEAIKNLSEAKMELRRKDQNVRQVTKDTQLVESEKRLLQEKLNDAEKAMTGAARERETVLFYLKQVQKGLEENKASLKQSSKRRSFNELSNFLITQGKLSSEGYLLGPTILACQNVVNGFLEVHQQTLVLVTQLEAEKQQAQVKMDSLQAEIKSHRSHINSLKEELAAVCQRQISDEEIYQYDRSHLDENIAKPYNMRRDPHLYGDKDSECSPREFVPLMRYDSLSPVKSPRKQEGKASYSREHKPYGYGTKTESPLRRRSKVSNRFPR